MKKALHRYEVAAYRWVAVPEAGPDAYYADGRRDEFPFGKGWPYSTGADALAAAQAHAATLLGEASEVTIWKCHGGGGLGTTLKRTPELFQCPWADLKEPA